MQGGQFCSWKSLNIFTGAVLWKILRVQVSGPFHRRWKFLQVQVSWHFRWCKLLDSSPSKSFWTFSWGKDLNQSEAFLSLIWTNRRVWQNKHTFRGLTLRQWQHSAAIVKIMGYDFSIECTNVYSFCEEINTITKYTGWLYSQINWIQFSPKPYPLPHIE